jgi:hypothetical protein
MLRIRGTQSQTATDMQPPYVLGPDEASSLVDMRGHFSLIQSGYSGGSRLPSCISPQGEHVTPEPIDVEPYARTFRPSNGGLLRSNLIVADTCLR